MAKRKTPSKPRAISPRNTGWNGVEQLIKGVDGIRTTGKSWKWQGHVNEGGDTYTKAGPYNIQGRGFDQVQRMLDQAGAGVNKMADDIVAKIGAEGRKEATSIEESEFRLGHVWEHANSKGGPIWTSSSSYDPSLGAYVGKSGVGNELRLMNFGFVKGHTYKYNGINPGTSKARFTSQLANLFENQARWRKTSPAWRQQGTGRWYGFRKGSTRRGRHYFGRVIAALDRGIVRALPKAQANFSKWMADPNRKMFA